MERYHPRSQLTLIVSPHIRPDGHKHPTKFDARLSDRSEVLCVSETPFFDAARVLLRTNRAHSGDLLVMRHAGSPHDALKATVGAAAELTIAETGSRPRRRRYAPYSGTVAGESGERIMRRGGLRGSRRPRRRFCA